MVLQNKKKKLIGNNMKKWYIISMKNIFKLKKLYIINDIWSTIASNA